MTGAPINCEKCELKNSRRRVVNGELRPGSKIFLVGMCPGYLEDLKGKPFIGDSGKELDMVLEKIKLERNELSISNACRCKPPLNRPKDKTLKKEEIRACRQYLIDEIKYIKPNVVVCMGNEALGAILGLRGVMDLRGVFYWSEELGCKVMVTIHPAAVLRQWEVSPLLEWDLKKAKDGCTTKELPRSQKTNYKVVRNLRHFDALILSLLDAPAYSADIECVGEDTEVIDYESGEVYKVKEAENILTIPSFKDGRFGSAKVSGFVAKGTKECLQLKAQYFQSIIVSKKHQMLTPGGWRFAKDLKVGGYLASPRNLEHEASSVLPDEEVKFLGYYIAEGSKREDSASVAVCEKELINDLQEIAAKKGYHLREEYNSFCLVTPKSHRGRGYKNAFVSLLKSTGLYNTYSRERVIPSIIFSLSKEQIALFLSRMFTGDGMVGERRIAYSTSSRCLAFQAQHLLSRFNIFTRVEGPTRLRGGGIVPKGNYSENYIVVVKGKSNLEKFRDSIGFFGNRKSEQLEKRISEYKGHSRPRACSVPCRHIREYLVQKYGELYPVQSLRRRETYIPSRKTLSYKWIRRFNETLKDPHLDWLCKFNWLELKEIKDVGKQKVYDLTVPKYHNFVANNFVVHNTTGFNFLTDKILCIGFSLEQRTGIVLPLLGQHESRLWSKEELKYIRDELKAVLTEGALKIFQNMSFDWKFLKTFGITVEGSFFDTMIAHHQLNENLPQSLDFFSRTYTDMGCYERVIKRWVPSKTKGTFADVPNDVLWKYLAHDVDCTFRMFLKLAPKIKEEGLEKLFYETTMPFSRVLAEAEYRGVLVDRKKLETASKVLESSIKKVRGRLFEEAGHEFNPNSSKQVGVVLFKEKGLRSIKLTPTGAKSTDNEVLTKLASRHKIAKTLVELRSDQKLKSTYVDGSDGNGGIKRSLDANDRTHPDYSISFTVTGRLSCRSPDLQNIPRKPPEIRQMFIAPKGWKILESDYSKAELWALALYSNCERLKKDLPLDFHKRTAVHMGIKSRIEDVDKEDENRSKMLVFGLCYGGREGGLSQSTGLPKGEVRKFINRWFELYPETEVWMNARRKDVLKKGYVTSFLGRRRRFYGLKFVKDKVIRKSEREAINSPIQGLVSDICCGAAVRIDKRIKENEFRAGLIMTTHDELFYEVPDEELAKIKEIVEQEMTAYIPELGMGMKVDIEVGNCWSENKKPSSLDLVQLGV